MLANVTQRQLPRSGSAWHNVVSQVLGRIGDLSDEHNVPTPTKSFEYDPVLAGGTMCLPPVY